MKTQTTPSLLRAIALVSVGIGALSFGLVGCQNTAQGVGEDAHQDGTAIKNAADNAGDATKHVAENAVEGTKNAAANAGQAIDHGAMNSSDALTLTPKVKNAIIANAKLNNPKNHINVDSKDGIVHLKGHVISGGMKNLAGEVAAKAVVESNSHDKVMNELSVSQ